LSTPLSAPTLQEVIQAVRDLLNQPDPNNSFWNDEELTRYINEAVRIHMAELADIDEGHFFTTTPLNIVSGVETIALPSDCFTTKSVYRVLNQRNILMSYNNMINDSYATGNSNSGESYLPEYYFRGNNLVLRQPPTFSETGGILIEYSQYPAQLLDSADLLSAQISVLFRQSIEMYGVYKAKLKESLANGIRVDEVAQENWSGLFKQFKDLSAKRSRKSTSVIPFDP
jgi:hypothetical protein